jgi:hypothetical protein
MRKCGGKLEWGRNRWIYGVRPFHAEYVRLQTHTFKLCNHICFSTAKMFEWIRPNFTLYKHCLSCVLLQRNLKIMIINICTILYNSAFLVHIFPDCESAWPKHVVLQNVGFSSWHILYCCRSLQCIMLIIFVYWMQLRGSEKFLKIQFKNRSRIDGDNTNLFGYQLKITKLKLLIQLRLF